MIFVQTGTPVNIYLSSNRFSLGGPPSSLASNAITIDFDKQKSFYGGKVYKFLYIKFDKRSENIVKKVQISYNIDYLSVSDVFEIKFLSNISVKFFLLPEWRKNVVHDVYNKEGISLTTGRHIEDSIREKQNVLSADVNLKYLDFFPFGLVVETSSPVERVYGLPLVLLINSFVE